MKVTFVRCRRTPVRFPVRWCSARHPLKRSTKKSLLLVMPAVVLTLFFTRATFSDPGPTRDHGLYFGAGAGLGYLNPKDTNAEIKVEEQKDAAGQVFLGLDLGAHFGAELAYTDLGMADLSDDATMRYQEASLSGLLYGLNKRSRLVQRRGLYGFGRAGVGRLFTSASGVEHTQENDYHLLLGAGAEFGFSNGISLRGEYTSFDHDAKYLHMSLLYRFFSHSTDDSPALSVTENKPASLLSVDSDHDGIGDIDDRCPDTADGLTVDQFGCPVFTADIRGVNFVSDSAELLTAATEVLDAVADSLSRIPDVAIQVRAHTDNQGPATYNRDLSRRRAISVARYLNSKGINKSRLILQAFGESVPIVSNETERGRYRNRRVEFKLVPQP